MKKWTAIFLGLILCVLVWGKVAPAHLGPYDFYNHFLSLANTWTGEQTFNGNNFTESNTANTWTANQTMPTLTADMLLGGISPYVTESSVTVSGTMLAGVEIVYAGSTIGGVTLPEVSGTTEVVMITDIMGSGLTVFTEVGAETHDRMLDGSSWGNDIFCVAGTIGNQISLKRESFAFASGTSTFWRVIGKVGTWDVE